MRRASLAAVNAPKVIKTDKLRSYAPAIDEIFPFAKPVKSEGLRAEINNNRSERRQGSYRAHIKTLRGLDSPEGRGGIIGTGGRLPVIISATTKGQAGNRRRCGQRSSCPIPSGRMGGAAVQLTRRSGYGTSGFRLLRSRRFGFP